MKNLLSLLLAVLAYALLPAQNTTWFVPGSQWRYDYESQSGPGQEVLKLVGTEIKGGQSRDDEYPQSDCGIAFNPDYIAFPSGSATWSEESTIWCGFTGYQYKVDGDTLLPNLGVAQKVYFRRTYTGTYPCPEGSVEILHEPFNLIGVISQSIPDQKVFFTRMTTDITPFPICLDPFGDDPFPLGETVLLYDFDLEVGDEVAWRSEPNVVLAIDSLQLNDGTWRRVYHFDTDSFYYWIEGIGSSIGLLNSRANLQITDVSCNLHCFRENNTLLYNLTDAAYCDSVTVDTREPVRSLAVRVYPNPSTGDVRMELPADGLPAMVRMFDSGGRLLETREIDASPAYLNLTPYADAGLLWMQIFSADGRRGEAVLRLER